MPKKLDLVGQRFGRLTVLEDAGKLNGSFYWKCICDCGNTCIVQGRKLRNGHTRSCGCLQKEVASKKNTKHGEWKKEKHPLYLKWADMKKRCNNPRRKAYKDYGGRGIKVCDEWKEYIPFRDWALKNGYEEGLEIDRVDVNGDYCPENCRFVTKKENARNKRNNRKITIGEETHTISEWREIVGAKRGEKDDLLYKKGEQAFIEFIRERLNEDKTK